MLNGLEKRTRPQNSQHKSARSAVEKPSWFAPRGRHGFLPLSGRRKADARYTECPIWQERLLTTADSNFNQASILCASIDKERDVALSPDRKCMQL